MGSPSVPDPEPLPPPPAQRPERQVEVEPEDVVLGTSDESQGANLKTKGKRSLTRPGGSTGGSSVGAQV